LELRFFGESISSMIHVMNILVTPALVSLVVSAEASWDSVFEIEKTPFRILNLGPIRHMDIKVPAHCLPHLLTRLSVPMLEALYLSAYGSAAFLVHRHQIPGLERVRFDKLLKLRLTWSANNDDCLSWLLKYFDFSATSIDAEIALGPTGSTSRVLKQLEFPNLKKFGVCSLGDLDYVSVPSLRHLTIPLFELQRANPWSRLGEAHQIAVNGITCLQLDLDVWLRQLRFMPDQAKPEFFQPFEEVTDLIITHQTYWFANYRWPKCWRNNSGEGALRQKSEILFPKLTTLQIDFPEEMVANYPVQKPRDQVFVEMLREIERFILGRKSLGYPIRTLRFNNCPDFQSGRLGLFIRAIEVDSFETLGRRELMQTFSSH
jgi:hypothetical protein